MPLALFLTGRTRTLIRKGTFSYQHFVDTTVHPGGYTGPDENANGEFQITLPWGSSILNLATGGSVNNGKRHGTIINVCDGFNSPITQDNSYADTGTPVVFQENISGNYTFTFSAAEWCLIDSLHSYDPTVVDMINGTYFPNFGGTAQGDGIPAIYCQFFELGASGGTSSATISDNFGTLTSTYNLGTGGQAIPNGYLTNYSLIEQTAGCACTASAVESTTFGTPGSISPAYNQTYSGADGSMSLYADGTTFTVNCGTSGNTGGTQGYLSATCAPALMLSASLCGRAWKDNYSLPMQLQWKQTYASGSWSPSSILVNTDYAGVWTQQAFQVTGTYNVGAGTIAAPSYVVNEPCPIRVWLDPSVSATGDDPSDWRVMIKGKPWQAFTLQQATSLQVGSGQTTSGSVTLTQGRWEGYGYLQFTANHSATLTLTNPQGQTKAWNWTVATEGTAQAITLDLCSPHTWSVESLPSVDGRISRYPLVTPSSTPIGSNPDELNPPNKNKGVYFGVFEVSSAAVSSIGGGGSITLGNLYLVRANTAKVSFNPGFLPSLQAYTDSSGNVYDIAPFGWLESDGKGTDFPAAELVTATGGSASYNFETITSFIGFLNYVPGWTATATGSYPDTYWNNNSLYAFSVFGGGSVFYGGSSGAWHDGIDVSMPSGTALTIYAQAEFDQVQGYPGIGDPWEGTGYPPSYAPIPMAIRATKRVRGQAWGLVLNSSNQTPLSGATVRATDNATSTQNYGSGVTDANGEYKTGLPYGPGEVNVKTYLTGVTSPPNDHQVWMNRWRYRDSFVDVIPSITNLTNLETNDGEFMIAYVGSDGNVYTQFWHSTVPADPTVTPVQVTTGGSWSWPDICMDHRRRIEMRACQTASGTATIYGYYSDDMGATWTPYSSPIMAATQSKVRDGRGKGILEVCYIPDSGTSGPATFQGRFKGVGDTSFSSFVTLVDQTGANLHSDGNGFGLDFEKSSANRFVLSFVQDGGSSPVHYYCADWPPTTWSLFT